jgi:hypothetical protein
MFYVCGIKGFIAFKHPHEKSGLKFTPDMREAQPFVTFAAADEFGKERLGETYYGIANTGWRSDPVSATPHHFDVDQAVKVIRGPHGESAPPTVRLYLKQHGVVKAVNLIDNVWTYTVEFDDAEHRNFTAKYLTQVHRYDEMPEKETPVDVQFTIYWRDGLKSLVTGPNVEQAMTKAGFGAGAAAAIDFYARGDDDRYMWVLGEWVMKKTLIND